MRLLALGIAFAISSLAADLAVFDSSGQLEFPADYRDWVFLSSGLGMTYGPAERQAGAQRPLFDNVFVNPAAWMEFKKSGQWPEGAIFVLEIRYSTSIGSINQGGHFQTEVATIEAAVKDTRRFPNGWGYFSFSGGLMGLSPKAAALPANSACQACHRASAAVEQSFVQFYPNALEFAKRAGTLRKGYQPHPPSPVALFHRIRDDGADAVQALQALKLADPKAAAFSDGNLNMLGYGLLQANQTEQAVAVLQWAVRAYPKSANTRDTLAEALEKAGKLREAMQESNKAAALIERDGSMDGPSRQELRKAIQERLTRLSRR
jgi:tetratricopeptide (TPR) repeat protein